MTAPTQAYPPWLSPVPVTVTQDGVVTVQTTVVQFPQTYYGPSIPLGPDWVFGGSTFPASIATSFSTPSASSSSTSAIPTSSAATTSLQTQSTASASTQTQSTTSASTPVISTTSSTSSSPSSPSSSGFSSPGSRSSGISSGTRLAIILSTILGTLMLAVLLFVLFRTHRRMRRRRDLAAGQGFSWSFINGSSTHQDDLPVIEDAEEADGENTAFLARQSDERGHMSGPAILPAWPKPPPHDPSVPEPAAVAAAAASPHESAGRKSDSSTLDSDAKRDDIARFNASSSTADVGSLFFNAGRNGDGVVQRRSDEAATDEKMLAAGVAAAFGSQPPDYTLRPPGAAAPRVPPRASSRPIAMPTPLHLQDASSRSAHHEQDVFGNDPQHTSVFGVREALEEEDDDAHLIPPRRIDPDRTPTSQPSSAGSRGSWAYPESPPSETDERATLLTARRVNLGQTAHPTLASPTTDKKFLEGWVTPPNEEEEKPPVTPRSWSVGMGGLAGFARGLGRLSWFRRMDSEAGPSGTRHSSPSRSRGGVGSRPTSMVGLAPPGSASRPHSGLLHPAPPGSASRPHSGLLRPSNGSRPQSGISFRSINAELGLRPPGVRASAADSGNGSGSGSGKSGATVYHSVSSRPRTPHYASSPERISHQVQFAHSLPTMVSLPPDLELGEGGSTVRSVDVLDLPVPERSLPLSSTGLPDTSSRSTKEDTVSSKGTTSATGLAFPPGLVSVTKWDKGSQSGSSNHEGRDVLEDEPPQAGGEWSSLRSKTSTGDINDEENTPRRRRGVPVTRNSTGEQVVQVTMGEHAPSETASIATGPRQPSDQNVPIASVSPRSPRNLAGFGLSLTPRVSMYETSRSEGAASHSGDGSYSSQPSQSTAFHSQGPSLPSSNPESDEGHHPPAQGAGFNRASLSAIGGEQGPPQLPPLRPLSNMPATLLERTTEDREAEGSDTSQPGTETSRPRSEGTHTGTFASGTGSTGMQTTVPSSPGSGGKR